MALTFVGFIGGSKHFDGSLALSTLGLLKTTYYTFLPCFVLILVGAPLIERTQHIASLKAVFSIITATVGGGRCAFPRGSLTWRRCTGRVWPGCWCCW